MNYDSCSNRRLLSWAMVLVLTSSLTQALAGDGDIIITRDVQSRVATRAPIAVDPNPRASNPGSITVGATKELSDGEFATVSTGAALNRLTSTNSLIDGSAQIERLPSQYFQRAGVAQGTIQRGVSGQVTRSIQQGLRPLHQLGER